MALPRASLELSAASRLARRLRRGGPWVMICRAACMATALGNLALLAHGLPTESFAAYVIISSLAVFGSSAAMFGLNTLFCRYISESFSVGDGRRATRAVRQLSGIAAVSVPLVGFVSWFCLETVGAIVLPPAATTLSMLVATWIMLLAVSQLVAEAFRGLHRLRMASLMTGASGGFVANLGLLISLFVLSSRGSLTLQEVVGSTVAWLMVPTLAATVYLVVCWPRQPEVVVGEPLPPMPLWAVVRDAIPIMCVQVLGFGLSQADLWIVAASCHDGDIAVYGSVRKLSLLVGIPLTQIGLVVSSSIAELNARSERVQMQRILRGGATVAILLTALPLLTLSCFPGETLSLVFGEAFRTGATPLRVMLCGQLVYVLTGLCGPTLLMMGRPLVPLCALLITTPLVAVIPWAARHHGLPMVAAVYASIVIVQNLLQWLFVRCMLRVKTQPDFSRPFLLALYSQFCAYFPYASRCNVAGE